MRSHEKNRCIRDYPRHGIHDGQSRDQARSFFPHYPAEGLPRAPKPIPLTVTTRPGRGASADFRMGEPAVERCGNGYAGGGFGGEGDGIEMNPG
jgi:hypothetical protein